MPRGRGTIGISELKRKQVQSRQMTIRDHKDIMLEVYQVHNRQEAVCPFDLLSESYKSHSYGQRSPPRSILVQQGSNQVLEVIYPRQPILHFNRLQKWHIACLLACFATIQLLNALLHKSIMLLEAAVPSGSHILVGGIPRSNDTSLASWQLCLSKPAPMRRHFFDMKSSGDMPCVGESSFEEAWLVAEQYLNEAFDNECEGAYFSYNCTTPHQERHESALGRWNRDNAGRLIRQLWAEND